MSIDPTSSLGVIPVLPVFDAAAGDNDPTKNGERSRPEHEALAREYLAAEQRAAGEGSAQVADAQTPPPAQSLQDKFGLALHPVAIEAEIARRKFLEGQTAQGQAGDCPEATPTAAEPVQPPIGVTAEDVRRAYSPTGYALTQMKLGLLHRRR